MLGRLVASIVQAGETPGPERRVLPADGKITITDYGYRDWPAVLVQYTVPAGKRQSGPVCLMGADGQSIPAQVDGSQGRPDRRDADGLRLRTGDGGQWLSSNTREHSYPRSSFNSHARRGRIGCATKECYVLCQKTWESTHNP